MSRDDVVIVVPLKGFNDGKSRLRSQTDLDISALSRHLAQRVLIACRPRRTMVVTDDNDVVALCDELGVEILLGPKGLNESVLAAKEAVLESSLMVVVHGDLARPSGLGDFSFPPAYIATDRHGTGTNVLALSPGLDFHFSYGIGSAALHRREFERLGIHVVMDTTSAWSIDIDEPDDLPFVQT